MTTDKDSIFAELNKQIKSASGEMPDTFTVGGETYQRRGSTVKGKRGRWVNPRDPNDVREDVELVSVTINVAPFADRITLNGTIYLANRTYDVPLDLGAMLRDIIAQTWRHEDQTGGANSYLSRGAVRNTGRLSAGVGYGQ